MNRHAREVLEFDLVVRELADYCYSDAARSGLLADFVESDAGFERLEAQLPELKAAVGLLRAGLVKTGDTVDARFADQSAWFEALEKPGLVLELEALADIARFVRASQAIGRRLRQLFEAGLESGAALAMGAEDREAGRAWLDARLGRLPALKGLETMLARLVDESGQLREDQIPELRQARSRILAAQSELRRSAQSIVAANADLISGEFATIRDGRMVIPLKTDYKGRLPGIVHQASASGATLFMEPFELVERNNACTEAEAAWAQALLQVLRQATAQIAQALPELVATQEILVDCDQAWCRARHSALHDCWPARVGAGIELIQSRHPLLGKRAIPIDLRIDAEKRLMVISGPNTGGKTVALKTLGLFALMNQAGMDLPAAQDSRLPLFREIHADIGDEQSISQSLSTFSGHISRIASLLGDLSARDLVLLDELGSGTDPVEGSALALAVTETLLERGVTTLVTSHHGAMKALAYTHPGACNASMEFSDQELRPTYRVIPGVPGQSHALDIASRVGLPSDILVRARAILGEAETPLETLVRQLAEQQQALREERELAQKERQELGVELARAKARQAELAERELELRKSQAAESGRFLKEARSGVEAVLRELDVHRSRLGAEEQARLQEAARQARASLADLARRQGGIEGELAEAEAELIRTKPLPDKGGLEPGAEVVVIASNQPGVLEQETRNGRWLVAIKGKKIEYRLDQLALPEQAGGKAAKGAAKPAWARPSWQVEGRQAAVLQLDLRGMRALEATDAIVRQIDAALVQGLTSFGIIHGKGEGILQKTIHDYLRLCPGVERYEFARPEDGGFGKTIVFLRR